MLRAAHTIERLEDANRIGYTDYWLTYEDIVDLARIEYNNFGQINNGDSFAAFDVVGSPKQLDDRLQTFKRTAPTYNHARLTLIINIAQRHWITMALSYQQQRFHSFLIDSLNTNLPEDYARNLQNYLPGVVNLSPYVSQTDSYNCGLWALENANSVNRMVNENLSFGWITAEISRPRNAQYFSQRRQEFAVKLTNDYVRQTRIVPLTLPLSEIKTHDPETAMTSSAAKTKSTAIASLPSNPSKKLKKNIAVLVRQDAFLKFFIGAYTTRLAGFKLIARGETITIDGLISELTSSFLGVMWGVGIAQSPAGSIPAVVSLLKSLGTQYFKKKGKAIALTRIFSEINNEGLEQCLAEVAIEIFQSYEKQFMSITDEAGQYIALEKLANDAAGRSLNYLFELHKKKTSPAPLISKEFIILSVLKGKSDSLIKLSFINKKVEFGGYHILDGQGKKITTASLYKHVGLSTKSTIGLSDQFFKGITQKVRYGYRRPFSWEVDAIGTLRVSEIVKYIEVKDPINETPYEYQMNAIDIEQAAKEALQRISPSKKTASNEKPQVNSILFNLRHPLKNFIGRTQLLAQLHQQLSSSSKAAVLTQFEQLSMNPGNFRNSLHEGAQATVSGLGGIGKTQLALKYANQHAADYDYNVLWIDSETKVNIINSFKELAQRLSIDLYDSNGQEKLLNNVLAEIYDYFSSAKSLFIFDNAEEPSALVDFLPKPSRNTPSVLITSRYSNWKNIATSIRLGVFEENEAYAFIKQELPLSEKKDDAQIIELANLLQLLPLALQQATAYINIERMINPKFGLRAYIEKFKQTSQDLLNFDLNQNTNDPYSKTILTTWEITLEKIRKAPVIGTKALEIIYVMAFLYPDHILNKLFEDLPNSKYVASALGLLKTYSLIDEGRVFGTSTIHRLVQKVLRLHLEQNRSNFISTIERVTYLTLEFTLDRNILAHFFTFQLHMLEYPDLPKTIELRITNRKIIETLACYQHDEILLNELFDFTSLTLSHEKFLNFIAEALMIYMRQPFFYALNNAIRYIEKKKAEGRFSEQDVKDIAAYESPNVNAYRNMRKHKNEPMKTLQNEAIKIIIAFKDKHHPDRMCKSFIRKRSVTRTCALAKKGALIDVEQIKTHVKKIRYVANLANLGLLTKDTLSALIRGDLGSVAINFGLISTSRLLGKLSNQLLIQGEKQIALGNSKWLLDEELDYDNKLAISLFKDSKITLLGKRRMLGSAMKVAAPFVARGTSLFFAYDFVKGLLNNQTDLSDSLSNAAIVGLDVGEAGIESLEYLGYIAGVSEFTGPIGEGLGFAIIAAIQLYHVEKELSTIEKWVHLTNRERFVQGLRVFFDFQPSDYLQAKAVNNQLVNNALSFLKLHPDIQRYVFSAGFSNGSLAQDNVVFLDRQRNLTMKTDSLPSPPHEGGLFCLEGALSLSHTISDDELWIKKRIKSLIELGIESLLGLEERCVYFCHNAIGVDYSLNRTGHMTLIALQGNSLVVGASSENLFLIPDGIHYLHGGAGDDLFILQGLQISGKIQGGLGLNILKFSDYRVNNGSILLDSQGFLCGKEILLGDAALLSTPFTLRYLPLASKTLSLVKITINYLHPLMNTGFFTQNTLNHLNFTVQVQGISVNAGDTSDTIGIYLDQTDDLEQTLKTAFQKEEFCVEGLHLANITQIYGRKNKQDKIIAIEGMSYVDSYAGESTTKPDYIYITKKSAKNLQIIVRPLTVVYVLNRNTTENRITINVPIQQMGDAFIHLPFSDQTLYQFKFESALYDLTQFKIEKDSILLVFGYPDGNFNLMIQNTDILNDNRTSLANSFFSQSAWYIFNQTLEIKLLDEKTLYAQWRENFTIPEIISRIGATAQRIEKSLIFQDAEKGRIIISSQQKPILSSDGLGANHLVSHGKDTVFVIHPPKGFSNPFPMNNISLYSLADDTSSIHTLDLRKVINLSETLCADQSISPELEEDEDDIILSLNSNYFYTAFKKCVQLETPLPLIQIRLKNTLTTYWHENLDILLHARTLHINDVKDGWKLASVSLVFPTNKDVIVLTELDIDKNDEIFIHKAIVDIGQSVFKKHNGNDLILTNMFSAVTSKTLYTILFSNFFKNPVFKEKVLTLTINFLDATWILNEYTELEINNASDFDQALQAHFELNSDVLDLSGALTSNTSALPLSRTRRETVSETSSTSTASTLTPFFAHACATITLKIGSFVNSIKNLAPLDKGSTKKTLAINKFSLLPIPAGKQGKEIVHCSHHNFFKEANCVTSQFAKGLVGYCVTTNHAIFWHEENNQLRTTIGISDTVTRHFVSNHHDLSTPFVNFSIIKKALYITLPDHCQQKINLTQIDTIPLMSLFDFIPRKAQAYVFHYWLKEKNKQIKIQQNQKAQAFFKEQVLFLTWKYLGSESLLHTFLGDYFQALGLKPNWREQDPSYFLARFVNTFQQIQVSSVFTPSSLAALALETALLHSKFQAIYISLCPKLTTQTKKSALRFLADVIQWRGCELALLPGLLETLFVDYSPIIHIAWGLRAALSLYSINNDPSYYYLGIGLFLLPQLPLLLEHIGIPVTAYVSKIIDKVTQLVILQSLFESIKPAQDEARITQRQLQLQQAERRVANGSARVSKVIKPFISFFSTPTVLAKDYVGPHPYEKTLQVVNYPCN